MLGYVWGSPIWVALDERKMNISRFFQYKCIRNQIWPCCNKDQGQHRFIICSNLVGPTSPVLYTKSQGHWPFGSRVEDIERDFTLYGHGRHLGDVTINIWFKFTALNLRSLHMKFEFNWPSGFRENCVLIYWWASNMSELGWKVNLDLWNCLLTYQVRTMTLASTVLKNQLFQKNQI